MVKTSARKLQRIKAEKQKNCKKRKPKMLYALPNINEMEKIYQNQVKISEKHRFRLTPVSNAQQIGCVSTIYNKHSMSTPFR